MIPKYLENTGTTKAFDGFTLLTVKNPRENLSQIQQRELIAALVKPSSAGFGRAVKESSLRNRVAGNQEYLLIPIVEGVLTGFCSASKMPLNGFLYCDGIVLAPEFQKLGIGTATLRELAGKPDCIGVTYTTQSPVMYLLMERIAHIVYPQKVDINIPGVLQTSMVAFMAAREKTLHSDTFVARELYSHYLYPNYPWTGKADVDNLFKSLLHFDESGNTRDGFLLVGIV